MARRTRRVLAVTAVLSAAAVSLAAAEPAAPCPTAPTVTDKCPAWSASYNHAGGRSGRGEDIGRAVAVRHDGAVFAAGLSYDPATHYDGVVAAFDKNGGSMWASRYAGPSTYDTFSDVAVSPDGQRVFATGRSTAFEADGYRYFDWATVAFDAATGKQLWAHRYAPSLGAPLGDVPWAVAVSPDSGTVYVGGQHTPEGASTDAHVIAYDAATGAVRWQVSSGGSNEGYDDVDTLLVAADGTLYAVGSRDERGRGDDFSVVALAPDGTELWSGVYDAGANANDVVADAVLSAQGDRLYLVGTTNAGSTIADVVTLAVATSDGSGLWWARHAGSRGSRDDAGGIAVSPAGDRVYISAGSSEAGINVWDYATIAYDTATGATVWTRLLALPGNWTEQATDIAVTADGSRIVTTGYVLFPRGEIMPIFKIEPGHMATVAYDTAGNQQWVSRFNNVPIGSDVGVGIKAGPTGRRVHTIGTFRTSGVYVYPTDAAMAYAYDIGTVAYDA